LGIPAHFYLKGQRKYFNVKVTALDSEKGYTRDTNSLNHTVSAYEISLKLFMDKALQLCSRRREVQPVSFLFRSDKSQEVGRQKNTQGLVTQTYQQALC
jgi:hypothetical protein